MKLLRIASDLTLPLGAVTEKMAMLGRTGSGKTYAATKLAEEMIAAGAQVITLDPVGVWWGLRLGSNGKDSGIAIPVFGGLHGDVPLEPTSGTLVADIAVDRGISLICDVSQFEFDTDKARFAKDFAQRFFFRKKASPSAVHLFLEECQEFMPERPQANENLMLHAFQRMWKLGRNFGIGGTLISQRPQEVAKKALNLSEVVFAFQLTGTHERKAVRDWISDKGLDEDIQAILPKLNIGEARVWSPGWLKISQTVKILPKWTLDASSTPKTGKASVVQDLTPIDIEALRSQMAATIERAKADDPKALRARIAELERALKAKAAAPAKANTADGKASKESLEKAALLGAAQMANQMAGEFKRIAGPARKSMLHTVTMLRAIIESIEASVPPESLKFKAMVDLPEVDPPAAPPPVSRRIGTEQRILNALAELEALGVENAPRVQVAFMAGYTNLASKGFANAIGALRTAGHIDYPGAGAIALTGSGRARGRTPEAPRTSEELQDRLIAMLGGANGRIVRALVEAYPDSLQRDELAAKAGYTNVASKGFANAIGRLRTLGFIDYPSPGQVAAQKVLFLEGDVI